MREFRTIPNTKQGRIAQIRKNIEQLEGILVSGQLTANIDGLSVSYRTRLEIERTMAKFRVELHSLLHGHRSPLGIPIPI